MSFAPWYSVVCATRILCILLGMLSVPTFAESLTRSLSSRVESLRIRPSHLFGKPKTPEAQELFRMGQEAFEKRYKAGEFKGYTLYQDPIDPKTGQVCFLKGTDCSHFVHRVYELMGAKYPYAKTRDFIHVFKGKQLGMTAVDYYEICLKSDHPIQMTLDEWRSLYRDFAVVDLKSAKPSDLLVLPRDVGPYGERGHVMMVNSVGPIEVLHAKDKNAGIVLEPLDTQLADSLMTLRFTGSIAPAIEADSLRQLVTR